MAWAMRTLPVPSYVVRFFSFFLSQPTTQLPLKTWPKIDVLTGASNATAQPRPLTFKASRRPKKRHVHVDRQMLDLQKRA